jgi:uncharacterized protein (DUF58 family)
MSVRAGRTDSVFAGQMASFEVHLDNPGPYPRIAVRIDIEGGMPMLIDVAPLDSARAQLAVRAERRGWLQLPTVTLSSTFPLGLFRAWSPINLTARALVYPRPAETGVAFPEHPGKVGAPRADSEDFHGFQSYQPGDPLRRIHWKGVAKGQGVHVKEYRDARDNELILDFALTPGDRETRLSRLCRWIIDADQAGLTYGLRLPHLSTPTASGAAHRQRCLEALALFPS